MEYIIYQVGKKKMLSLDGSYIYKNKKNLEQIMSISK